MIDDYEFIEYDEPLDIPVWNTGGISDNVPTATLTTWRDLAKPGKYQYYNEPIACNTNIYI